MDPAPKSQPPFLDRERLARLMSLDDYFNAVEAAFRAHAQGRTNMPLPLYIPAEDGGFHAKGARVDQHVAVKVNSNFPGNSARDLPTIQGAVLLYDATDGRLLAILDSMEITAKRTAATSALAARHLARLDSPVVAICGCGEQGRAQLAALWSARPVARAYAWDTVAPRAREFAQAMGDVLDIDVIAVEELRDATLASDIIVTATSSSTPFLTRDCVRPGTFIAAIGADNPHKSELHPDLFVGTKVVVDTFEQASTMGDPHHALRHPGIIVHAELAEIVTGRKPGRSDDTEITIFDSTGLAIQDVASAAVAYARFLEGEKR